MNPETIEGRKPRTGSTTYIVAAACATLIDMFNYRQTDPQWPPRHSYPSIGRMRARQCPIDLPA
jgi:hypothetical protein